MKSFLNSLMLIFIFSNSAFAEQACPPYSTVAEAELLVNTIHLKIDVLSSLSEPFRVFKKVLLKINRLERKILAIEKDIISLEQGENICTEIDISPFFAE